MKVFRVVSRVYLGDGKHELVSVDVRASSFECSNNGRLVIWADDSQGLTERRVAMFNKGQWDYVTEVPAE